ncbi:hydrogenase expression protein HypF [Streptomyces taklimakanensis]|uniref:hydrogenase expression protein HypF n=1 Tax=Streptomyces taklimakanensis TaxID=2569853 RepID=UPI0012BB01EC|nr:hydrogenase expression protein HypF [Streptomyces taklimakanensis]
MLTRLHVPAGKAIALAAMPSAVLMGMGLTPRLATAEPLPENPFKDGPCVTAPDRTAEEDTGGSAGEEEKPAGTARPETSPAPAPTPEAEAPKEPSAPFGPSDHSDGTGTGDVDRERTAAPEPDGGEEPADGGAGGGAESVEEPVPAPSESRNPLDPLGIGGALEDLFTRDGGERTRSGGRETDAVPAEPSSPTPSPSASGRSTEPVEPPELPELPELPEPVKPVKEAVERAGKETGKDPRETAGPADRTPRETAGDFGPKDGEEAEAVTPAPGAGGKEPYPCPTYDAEALAEAEEERTEALLPDRPWRLETSLLALHGLDYHGIVKVRTYGGGVKDVLKFTARSVDIRDLHQIVEGPGGSTAHVEAAEGSTSTIRNGTVTMYTEELKGNLFGVIPVTFSPKSPPPLDLSEVFFTEVSVTQAGQFGGTLHIPGMHLYNEN